MRLCPRVHTPECVLCVYVCCTPACCTCLLPHMQHIRRDVEQLISGQRPASYGCGMLAAAQGVSSGAVIRLCAALCAFWLAVVLCRGMLPLAA